METKIISSLEQIKERTPEELEKFMKDIRDWMLNGGNCNWTAERDIDGNLILIRS